MKLFNAVFTLSALATLAACNGGADSTQANGPVNPSPSGDLASGTRPAGAAPTITVDGRIEQGAECRVLATPDGRRYAFSAPEGDFPVGEYVEITGEMADAAFCMEGDGTIIVATMRHVDPAARDRDPDREDAIL